ncbi:MAG TPA: hypothetical protein PLS34_01195 [Gammaproteobacteria bacterium]|nr:hypothetical protein [Gammaproteobacteria bacterium]
MKITTYCRMGLLAAAAAAVLAAAAPLNAQERPPRDPATETCESYDQDVRGDIALLQQEARQLTSAVDGGAEPPAVEVVRHYAVTLHPQGDVKFVVEPSRVMLADGSFAGHMSFSVPVTGRYRIGLTSESWVDVLAGGDYLDAAAFSGRVGCKPLRKLVDYQLDAGKPYVLMLSGGSEEVMGLAIRPVHEG